MFILGKLLVILLNPVMWIVSVLLYARFVKNDQRKRKAYLAGIIMLVFFSNPFIVDKFTLAYQAKKYSLKRDEVYSAGILLGGFAGKNNVDDQIYFGENADRFIQASQLYANGHVKKIIIAAGSGEAFKKTSFREADYAYEQFVNMHIPEEDLLPERNSRNTQENAINSKKIIDSLQLPPPYLLITSAIHMPRAMATFKKAGLDVKPYPAAFQVTPSKVLDVNNIIPTAQALRNWSTLIREVVGIVLYKIIGRG